MLNIDHRFSICICSAVLRPTNRQSQHLSVFVPQRHATLIAFLRDFRVCVRVCVRACASALASVHAFAWGVWAYLWSLYRTTNNMLRIEADTVITYNIICDVVKDYFGHPAKVQTKVVTCVCYCHTNYTTRERSRNPRLPDSVIGVRPDAPLARSLRMSLGRR